MVTQTKKIRGRLLYELSELLSERFSEIELRKLSLLHLGPGESNTMPGFGASLAACAIELAQALWRHDAINECLFAEIELQRPRAKQEIDKLRTLLAACTIPVRDVAPRQPEARAVASNSARLATKSRGKEYVYTQVVYVTPRVAAQARGEGNPHQQITIRGVLGGTRESPQRVRLEIHEQSYSLLIGDSHAAWWSHQQGLAEYEDSFKNLFAKLSAEPGVKVPITKVELA